MDDDRNNKTGSVWSNELQKIKSIIERENLKFTIQKQLILEALLSSKEHMTINELHDKLKVNNIGIATLYRNLDSFKNLGIITEINVEGKAYYEMKIFGRKPIHIHFKCTNCGKIIEFIDEEIEKRQDKIAKKNRFRISSHSMQLYGTCETCQG